MSRIQLAGLLLVVALAATQADRVQAQQVQLTAPFHSINDSFYENFGSGWGLNGGGRNWFFNTGPAGSAPPPFGGWDPGADARFGFGGVTGGGVGFNFNWLGSQGSNRSHVMQAPTIVIPNGGSGSLFSGSIRPFVTGVVPIVGNAPRVPMVPVIVPQTSTSPVQERLERLRQQEALAQAAPPPRAEQDEPVAAARDDAGLVLRGGAAAGAPASMGGTSRSSAGSTASHGDISVSEIRRQQALENAAREQEILVKIEKARGYEEAGKPGVAKIYYQQAARQAEGEMKQKLLAKINSLSQ